LPDTSKLEKLNRELEKSEKKLRKAINDEKALQHQLKQLTRKERTHRLCTRGGMLESFLQEPDATLPLRWLPPATLLCTCHLGTPCVASCSQPTSFIKYAIFSIANEV